MSHAHTGYLEIIRILQLSEKGETMSIKLLKYGMILFLLCLQSSVGAQRKEDVRKPAVAGQFYEADAQKLRQDVQQYLANAKTRPEKGRLVGLSVPHAGYVYSASVAAEGYKQIQGYDFEVVVIMAPSHRAYFKGGSIYPGSAYETPLGLVKINQAITNALLAESAWFVNSYEGHGPEHAVEVQLPFIQTVLPKAEIVPVVIGAFDWSMCEKMGKALAKAIQGRKVLLLASTDLYHGNSYAECQQNVQTTLAAVTRMAPHTLCQGFLAETYQACGAAPVVVLQVAALESAPTKAVLLQQTNSNDVTGQKGGYVVGYGAVAYYADDSEVSGKKSFKPLPLQNQRELLKMARESIKYYLTEKKKIAYSPTDEWLKEKRGVFVTLTKKGLLRGCIGYHEADRPLYELVPDRAIAAAFSDPRFPALQSSELDEIEIKISVYLTNVYLAGSLDEFEMGKHGIIMIKDGRGATYLPEVPIEAGWKSKQEEMESLCQKAGLPPGAWKKDAQFYLYETQVFDESILKP